MKNHELTVAEAAESLGVGTPYIYVLIRNKQLKARKDGNSVWRISAQSVDNRKRKGAKNGRRN